MKNSHETQYTQSLKGIGLKVTPSRLAILDILHHHKGPLSCEKIFKKVNGIVPCDLVTVYRNLSTFVRLGLVQESSLVDGVRFFELASQGLRDKSSSHHRSHYQIEAQPHQQQQQQQHEQQQEPRHHHHHVICISCRKITCLSFCSIQKFEDGLADLGYRDIEHRLEFFALCPSCQ